MASQNSTAKVSFRPLEPHQRTSILGLDAYEVLPSGPGSLAVSHGNSGTSASDYRTARCSGDAPEFLRGNSRSAAHTTGTLLRVVPGNLRTKPRPVPRHA